MKADTMNIELPSQAGTVLAILKAILNDSGGHQTEAVKRALSAYGEECFEAGRSRAASEPGEVAREELESPVVRRVIDLHEKASMPWSQAEELALSEFGFDDDDLRELIGEFSQYLDYLTDREQIKEFARHVLVFGPDYIAKAPLSEIFAAAPQPASSPVAAEGQKAVKWGYAKTVGNAIAQLQTMDPALPFYAALHLQDGRCIARGVTFSRERVVNERWIDNTNKDVPYSIVVWSQPVQSLFATPTASMADAAEAVASPSQDGGAAA